MTLLKTIRVEIRRDSWGKAEAVPKALIQSEGSRQIDVLYSLLFCALCTRPPVSFGFSLADCWAWMRYLPAICNSPELRLCDEWTSLDPHQKTVLSGDFGVGFTTWFLHQTLKFKAYADTLWVVNTLAPGTFELARSAKRGPRKSPDYIAIDDAGGFSVLECKGVQTSHASLVGALGRGTEQKQNLRTLGAIPIKHSLVAGLFIPQFSNPEHSTLVIADPEWDVVENVLGQYGGPELERGVAQVATAKQTAILELYQTANTLARAKKSHGAVYAAFSEDMQVQTPGRVVSSDEVRVRRDYRWPVRVEIGEGLRVVGVRFEGKLAAAQVEQLRTTEPPQELAEQSRERVRTRQWAKESGEMFAELRSPLGGTFRLTLLD